MCRLQAISVGIIAVTIVQQQDRARRRALDRAACDLIDAGPVGVPDAERPPDGALPQRARDSASPTGCGSRAARERSAAWAPPAFNRVGAKLEVTPYVRGRPEVKFPMVVAVVADRVPFVGGAGNQIRPSLGVAAEDEEGRFDAALGRASSTTGVASGFGPSSNVSATARSCVARRRIAGPKMGLLR